MKINISVETLDINGLSKVAMNGVSINVMHSRLLSRDGKKLQACKIQTTSIALSDAMKAAIRTAINQAADRATAQYRSLRNASKAA